jgi:hypothetical protein
MWSYSGGGGKGKGKARWQHDGTRGPCHGRGVMLPLDCFPFWDRRFMRLVQTFIDGTLIPVSKEKFGLLMTFDHTAVPM